jgi:hypothetical protein
MRVPKFMWWCGVMLVEAVNPAFAVEALPADSIFVDGQIIRVQASVEIDTVSRPRRWQFGWNLPGPEERRPIKRKAPNWNAVYGMGRVPIGGVSDGLDGFARGWPPTGFGLGWAQVMPRPGQHPWGFGWAVEAQVMSASDWGKELPDSLMGFLPRDAGSVWAVTRQRFDIGVETDTVVVGLQRARSVGWGAHALVRAEWFLATPVTLSFGLERWSDDRPYHSITLPESPDPPVTTQIQSGGVWQPVMRMGVGHAWARTHRRGAPGFSERWSAEASLTWRPAEVQSISFRVQLTRRIGAGR